MNQRARRLRTLLLLAAVVVVVGVALALQATHALERPSCTSVDERFNIRGHPAAVPSDVVIVAIDDKTFNDLKSPRIRSGASCTRR